MTPRLVSDARAARRADGPPRTDLVGLAVVVILGLVALWALAPLLARPAHVDRIGVRNPHAWHATVAVSGEDEGVVAVGRVPRESERDFHAVLDQGDVWTFRFSYDGAVEEVQVRRDELEAAGWVVEVPPAFEAAVAATGALPSARD
jgi:hypothetical protein